MPLQPSVQFYFSENYAIPGIVGYVYHIIIIIFTQYCSLYMPCRYSDRGIKIYPDKISGTRSVYYDRYYQLHVPAY